MLATCLLGITCSQSHHSKSTSADSKAPCKDTHVTCKGSEIPSAKTLNPKPFVSRLGMCLQVIPKSHVAAHQKENADIFDFNLQAAFRGSGVLGFVFFCSGFRVGFRVWGSGV